MIDHLIPLISSFISAEFLDAALYPLFCGYFIASVPGLLRLFTKWR